jgi:hypothetical protein
LSAQSPRLVVGERTVLARASVFYCGFSLEVAETVVRRSGSRFWELMVIPKIAVLQARSGDPVTALGSFRQMLNALRRSADLMFASHGIGSLIALFERIGQTQAAATLHGFLSPMFDTSAFLAEFPQISP